MDRQGIAAISFSHLCCDINGAALPALLPFLAAAYDLSYTAAAGIIFAYSCISSVIQPCFGYLADRVQKFWFIPLGIFLACFGVGILGFLETYATFFAAAVVSGIGCAVFHPEAATFASFLSGQHKGAGMSLFSIGGNSGFALGPLLVSIIIPTCGFHGTAVFLVLGVTVSIALFFFFKKRALPRTSLVTDSHHAPLENNWPAFGHLTGVVISRSVLYQAFNTFLALYWVTVFGASAATGAVILTLFAVIGVISNLTGGILSDRFGHIRMIRLSQWCLFPGILCFPLAPNVWTAGCILLPVAFALYASFSPMVLLGQRYLAKNIGFASGVTLGLSRTAGGVAMPIVGMIADHYGLQTAFSSLAVLAGLGILFSLSLKPVTTD